MFNAREFLLSALSCVVDSKEKLQINLGLHKVSGLGSSVGIVVPVGTRFSACPDWLWGPPSLL